MIVTYNRIENAKIQMELIRNLWSSEELLENITVYHAYNGEQQWYPQKYLEDFLIRCENPGFYEGAALLIDSGIRKALSSKTHFDYIIVTSADVWLIKPYVLVEILQEMERRGYALATSQWFFQKALATEFFIIDSEFAKDVFPLELPKFEQRHKFLTYLSRTVINKPILEVCFAERVASVLGCAFNSPEWRKKVYLLPQRCCAHWFNHYDTPVLGYLSYHNTKRKREIVIRAGLDRYGPSIRGLVDTVDENLFY